jgi:hypothetical protein
MAEYSYSDGSTKTLVAGNGFGLIVNQKLTTYKSVELIAGVGFQWGSISDDTTSTSFYDGLTYFPAELNAKYNLTKEIAVKGGLSYLLMPTYVSQVGNYKAKIKGSSNLGYNLSLQYDLEGVYLYGKYSANKISYTEFSDSDGAKSDISGAIDDEVVGAIQFGVGIDF